MVPRLHKEISALSAIAALLTYRRGQPKLATALSVLAVGLRFLPSFREFKFDGRHVLITGGSRGLGLALAYELVREGARVSLLARDRHELDAAKFDLEQPSNRATPAAQVAVFACDVTASDQVLLALNEAHARFGQIDMVINNAGTITAAPFESLDREDFNRHLDIHLHAIVEITRQLVPYFFKAGGGRIVNIASIGGKIPVPHMSSYCASKFALAGFSEAVAAEVARHNIQITTVYPGLMRTGSVVNACFKGDHEKEYAWFSAADSTPGLTVTAEAAAKEILAAARQGDRQCYVGWAAKLSTRVYANFPELTSRILELTARLLPQGYSLEGKTGLESQAWFIRQPWSLPFRKTQRAAQARFNQPLAKLYRQREACRASVFFGLTYALNKIRFLR